MQLTIEKYGKQYRVRIILTGTVVYDSIKYTSREAATLDAWQNALMIRDIATATRQSVEALLNV